VQGALPCFSFGWIASQGSCLEAAARSRKEKQLYARIKQANMHQQANIHQQANMHQQAHIKQATM